MFKLFCGCLVALAVYNSIAAEEDKIKDSEQQVELEQRQRGDEQQQRNQRIDEVRQRFGPRGREKSFQEKEEDYGLKQATNPENALNKPSLPHQSLDQSLRRPVIRGGQPFQDPDKQQNVQDQEEIGRRLRFSAETRQKLQNFIKREPTPISQKMPSDTKKEDIFDRWQQERPRITEQREDIGKRVRRQIDRGGYKENLQHLRDKYHYYKNEFIWAPIPWVIVAHWGGWGWPSPNYYDYFEGYPILYSNGSQVYARPSPMEYQRQGENLLLQANEAGEEQRWLPLGFYVIITEKADIDAPSMYIQLALSKEGNLQGILYSSINMDQYPIYGFVDPDTQLAVWQMVGSANAPIMATGLYNLTLPESPMEVYLADNTQQTWLLVNLAASEKL